MVACGRLRSPAGACGRLRAPAGACGRLLRRGRTPTRTFPRRPGRGAVPRAGVGPGFVSFMSRPSRLKSARICMFLEVSDGFAPLLGNFTPCDVKVRTLPRGSVRCPVPPPSAAMGPAGSILKPPAGPDGPCGSWVLGGLPAWAQFCSCFSRSRYSSLCIVAPQPKLAKCRPLGETTADWRSQLGRTCVRSVGVACQSFDCWFAFTFIFIFIFESLRSTLRRAHVPPQFRSFSKSKHE